MKIVVGSVGSQKIAELKPEMKHWWINCRHGKSVLHISYPEDTFKNFEEQLGYVILLGEKLGGIKITPSDRHFFFDLKQVESKGQSITIEN